MKQVKLKHHNTVQTCWLEEKPTIKKGAFISLKESPETLWEVIEVYDFSIPKKDLHQPWHVGGL